MPGTTLGSVHYFSPEQARGETATNEVGHLLAGIVLYEMLTGLDRGRATALRPWRLPGWRSGPRSDAGPAVGAARRAAITRKALAPLPIDRFASATAMADAIESSRTAVGGAGVPTTVGAAAVGAGVAAVGGVARSTQR